MSTKYDRPRGGGSLFLSSKPSNAQVVYQCKACPAGSYSSSETGYKCKKCGKGTYSSSLGSTSCSKCGKNQYTDVEGATGCKSCQLYDPIQCSCPENHWCGNNFVYELKDSKISVIPIFQNYKKMNGVGLLFDLQTMCNDHVQFLQKLLNVSNFSVENMLIPPFREVAKSGFYTHENFYSYKNKRLIYMINDGFKYDFYKIVNLYLANFLFLHSKCFENGNYVTPSERKNLIDNGLMMFISDEGNQISEVDDILQNKLKNFVKLSRAQQIDLLINQTVDKVLESSQILGDEYEYWKQLFKYRKIK